jgi:hypothetical protein
MTQFLLHPLPSNYHPSAVVGGRSAIHEWWGSRRLIWCWRGTRNTWMMEEQAIDMMLEGNAKYMNGGEAGDWYDVGGESEIHEWWRSRRLIWCWRGTRNMGGNTQYTIHASCISPTEWQLCVVSLIMWQRCTDLGAFSFGMPTTNCS